MATDKKKARVLKPRQLDFIENYTNPVSETYSNAVRSAVKAGYTYKYAIANASKVLTPLATAMVKEREDKAIEKQNKYSKMLDKAVEAIDKDLQITDDAVPALRAIRAKQSAFVAETIGNSDFNKGKQANITLNVALEPNIQQVLKATMTDLLDTSETHDATYTVIDEPDNTPSE